LHLGQRGEGGDLSDAPEAARPDRVVGVAGLELDPDVRADGWDDEEADLRPREGRARHRPAHPTPAEHRGHAHLDPPHLHRVDVVLHLSAVLPEEGRHGTTAGTDEPTPSRVIVKLCRYSPWLRLWLTRFT